MTSTDDPLHPNPTAPRAGRAQLKLGITLAILGFILGPGGMAAGMIFLFTSIFSEGRQFAAPGEVTIHIDKPRRHVIWHETSGMFEGRVHAMPTLPSGTRVEVFDAHGHEVPITSSTSSTLESGSTKRRSVARFDPPAPGDYRVRISGIDPPPPGAAQPPAVFYVSPDILTIMLFTIPLIACSGILGIAMLVGGIILIVLATGRRRA